MGFATEITQENPTLTTAMGTVVRLPSTDRNACCSREDSLRGPFPHDIKLADMGFATVLTEENPTLTTAMGTVVARCPWRW